MVFKFISSLYNACFRDHFSSDLCKNVINGVLFMLWLLLLVLFGKVGWNKCEQSSPSNPRCGRHVFTRMYISLWSFSQQLDFLICGERCLLIPTPECITVFHCFLCPYSSLKLQTLRNDLFFSNIVLLPLKILGNSKLLKIYERQCYFSNFCSSCFGSRL